MNDLTEIQMSEIRVAEICGTEVLSRANVRKLYEHIGDETESIDMSGVKFISRSVADELCNISDRFPALKFDGMTDDVAMMLGIVRKGRGVKRDYTSKAKVSMTFNCKTMDDLRKALSFGM